MSFIVILSGDVELNPGSGSVEGDSDSSCDNSFEILANHLSILHLNVQSLLPKLDLIAAESEAYNVLVFSESWLKPDIKNDSVYLNNFHPRFRTDRSDRPGGGVVIYVRDSIYCKRRNNLEVQGLEAAWVEIHVKSKTLLVGGFYRPPNSNAAYFELLSESIDRAYNTNIIDIFILGDFNYNLAMLNVNKMTDLIQEYNLTQLISEHAHFTELSSSMIDLILVRSNAHVLSSGDTFIPDQVRYHCPTVVLLKFLRTAIKTYSRRIWNYKLADFDKFRELLSDYSLIAKLEETTVLDINAQQITDALFFAAEQSIPNKVVTIMPWINCQIKKLIRKRKRFFKIFRRTGNPLYWERYNFFRNRVVTEIRNSKKNYFDKLDILLSTNTTNSKLFWRTAKVLNLGKSSNSIPTVKLIYAEDDIQKANMLNAFYISQAAVNDDKKRLADMILIEYSFNVVLITCQDVGDVLQNFNVSKSCGPDLISPRLLREGTDILDKPPSTVFNRSIDKCYFPSQWKDGNVTPTFKKDEKTLPSNYRPITLLSLVGKTMERCAQKRLYNNTIAHRLITPLQSGFI